MMPGVATTVLVLRALGMGDGLAGVAALRGLRRMAPAARLVLAAPAGIGGFLRRRGVVDEVLQTPELDALTPRLWASRSDSPPDVAVDLHGCGPASHRLLQALGPGRLIAWRCPAAGFLDGPEHRLDEQEVVRWCRLVTAAGGPCSPADLLLDPADLPPPPAGRVTPGAGHYAVVHPGATSASRRWPAYRFAAVAAELSGRGWPVAVTGSAGERALTGAVTPPGGTDLGGALDLDRLAALVADAGLVVCGDTGVAHLATAYRTPSVLLFGPTPPGWWGPSVDTELHPVLWHGPALAAGWHGAALAPGWHGPAGGYRGDPHGATVDPALDRITVGEVLAAVDGLPDRGTPVGSGSTGHGSAPGPHLHLPCTGVPDPRRSGDAVQWRAGSPG